MTHTNAYTTLLDFAARVAELGANWLVQSTLLLAVGLVGAGLARRHGSAAQSAIYRTTLVAVLCCPLATSLFASAGLSGWSVELPQAWSWRETSISAAINETVGTQPEQTLTVAAEGGGAGAAMRSDSPAAAFAPNDAGPNAETFTPPLPASDAGGTAVAAAVDTLAAESSPTIEVHRFGLIAVAASGLWLLGTLLLGGRLALAWWRLARVRRQASRVLPETLAECQRIATLLGVQPPEVLRSPYLPSPCLAGLSRPVVLLPAEDGELPLGDVMIHELAHLRRRDCHWNLLRRIATALLFFQPLLWKLARRLEETAEEVCDDYVVTHGGDRQRYAHRLVDIAELSTAPIAPAGVGVVSLRSMLCHRVARILDTTRSLSTRVGTLPLTLVLIAGLLGTTIAGLVGLGPQSSQAEAKALADESDPVAGVEADEVAMTVRGKVVDLDGRPISAAKLYVVGAHSNGEVRAVTDTKGNFAFDMRKPEFGLNDSGDRWQNSKIVAVAEGFGVDFREAYCFEPTGQLVANMAAPAALAGDQWDRTLRLVQDDVPLLGKITTTDGQAVAGATVRVSTVYIPKDKDLGPWLQAVERGEDYDVVVLEMMDRVVIGTPLPEIMPTATTKPDGTFRLSGGLGQERIVRLTIEGPGIVSRRVFVRTRPGPMFSVPHLLEGPNAGIFRFFGSSFMYEAQPSTPIVGTVRDQASGEPIAGISIRLDPGSIDQTVNMEFDSMSVRAVTDENGTYRLTGAPNGEDHRVLAVPSGQPYLPASKRTTLATGQVTPDVDFELTKGVRIEGRVTDAETGEPVPAQLTYFLPRDNALYPTAKGLGGVFIDAWQDPYQTNEKGAYANVGLPGRGFLTVLAKDHRRYPRGSGPTRTKEKHKDWPRLIIDASPYDCIPANFNYVAELNIPNDVDVYQFDIVLIPEGRLEGIVLAPDGKPLAGATYAGLSQIDGPYFDLASPRFTINAYQPDKPRQVFFVHKERRLAGSLLLQGPQDGSLEVQLEPWGAITGRIVDAKGEPQPQALIRGYAPGRRHGPGLGELPERHYRTDEEGRFQIEGFVPGLKYDLDVIVDGEIIPTTETDFDIGSGETRDLGDVQIQVDAEEDAKQAQVNLGLDSGDATAGDVRDDDTKAKSVDADEAPTVAMRGRVVDDAGQPIAGAKVRVIRSPMLGSPTLGLEHQLLSETIAGADGQFSVDVPRIDSQRTRISRFNTSAQVPADIVATADGYTFDWAVALPHDREVELRLDRRPGVITGRLVDPAGKPLIRVDVEVLSLRSPAPEAFAGWLTTVEELRAAGKLPLKANVEMGTFYSYFSLELGVAGQVVSGNEDARRARFPGQARLWAGHPVLPAAVKTDKQGRFTIAGLGRDRLATLLISGTTASRNKIGETLHFKGADPRVTWVLLDKNVLRHQIDVVTRDIEPAAIGHISNFTGQAVDGYYGATFEHTVLPGLGVDGTVSDAETGEPIAGVRVTTSHLAGSMVTQEGLVSTTTNADGRYVLEGLPHGEGNRLKFVPGSGLPYFITDPVEVPVGDTPRPVTLDLTLRRGAIVRGRVTDAETGEPVEASVHYHPLLENKQAAAYRKFESRYADDMDHRPYRTGEDGTYELVVAPGKGLIGVNTAVMGQYCVALGSDEIDEPGEDGRYETYGHCTPKMYNRLSAIDVPAQRGEIERDLSVSRGRTVTLRVTDADGRPLPNVIAAGQTPRGGPLFPPNESNLVDVVGLRPDETRQIILIQREHKLARSLMIEAPVGPVEGDSSDRPLIVRLEPCGIIKGRLLDGEGNPVAGATFNASVVGGTLDFSVGRLGWQADNEGDFRYDLFPPGVDYRVVAHSYDREAPWQHVVAERLSVKPGETIDLGTIKAARVPQK